MKFKREPQPIPPGRVDELAALEPTLNGPPYDIAETPSLKKWWRYREWTFEDGKGKKWHRKPGMWKLGFPPGNTGDFEITVKGIGTENPNEWALNSGVPGPAIRKAENIPEDTLNLDQELNQ